MSTFDLDQQHVQRAEQRRADAEQELSRCNAGFRRWQTAVEALGGEGAARPDMLERGDSLSRQVAGARNEVRRAEGALAEARQWAADNGAYVARSKETHPSGFPVDSLPEGATAYPLGGQPRALEGGPRWVRTNDMRPAVVERGQSVGDHPVVQQIAAANAAREQAVIGQHGSLGMLVRSMTTTSGSAIVPTIWSSQIIDRARNLCAVLKAGAEVVPMDSKVVQLGRLVTDPVAGFRAEGSNIASSDPVFDAVVLTAKTLSAQVTGSMEWFADAVNADQVVSEAIAQAIAQELDKQALFGGLSAGAETGATGFNTTFPSPPNPVGILSSLLANLPANVLGSAANGTTQTAGSYFAELLDTYYRPQYANEAPTAMIANAKLWRQYAGAADTTNQPLRMPADLEALQKFSSNQVPSFTQGTMTTRATDVFCGDFRQVLVGTRMELTIQVLSERYAEAGMISLVAHWRGDVALARPGAMCVFRYLQGA